MAEKKLVSVEVQNEHSVTIGQRETRIFVKMYVDAVHSGLLADMGAENWQTLCAISSFMNERGECYPTQELIAHRLGITRQAAGRRIAKLIEYRWNGRPIVSALRKRKADGSWDVTHYTVLPISQLEIFGNSIHATSSQHS